MGLRSKLTSMSRLIVMASAGAMRPPTGIRAPSTRLTAVKRPSSSVGIEWNPPGGRDGLLVLTSGMGMEDRRAGWSNPFMMDPSAACRRFLPPTPKETAGHSFSSRAPTGLGAGYVRVLLHQLRCGRQGGDAL